MKAENFQVSVSVVLNGSEIWAVKGEDLIMVWWICNVTLKDRKSSYDLRDYLGL